MLLTLSYFNFILFLALLEKTAFDVDRKLMLHRSGHGFRGSLCRQCRFLIDEAESKIIAKPHLDVSGPHSGVHCRRRHQPSRAETASV